MSLGGFFKQLVVFSFFPYIFCGSGLIVNFLQLLSWIIVKPFSIRVYRIINYHLAYSFWSNLTFLGQYWSGTKVVIYLDEEDFKKIASENFIGIMNHSYDIEWLIGWIVCQRTGLLGGSKIIGKSSLRFVPLIGWCWVFTESIFIDRKWESDKKKLKEGLDKNLANYPDNYHFNVLMFCEGTRFTKAKHEASMKIAREKGLPELKYHLLPRTKGFSLVARGAQETISAIYDLNVGISEKNGNKANLLTILNGIPLNGEIFIRRIPMSNVPSDEEGSAKFLHKFYQEKDKIMDVFHKHDSFESLGVKKIELPMNYYDFYIVSFWIILMCAPLAYFLYFSLSLTVFLFTLAILTVFYFIGSFLIGVSKTDRGSDYGLKTSDKKADESSSRKDE